MRGKITISPFISSFVKLRDLVLGEGSPPFGGWSLSIADMAVGFKWCCRIQPKELEADPPKIARHPCKLSLIRSFPSNSPRLHTSRWRQLIARESPRNVATRSLTALWHCLTSGMGRLMVYLVLLVCSYAADLRHVSEEDFNNDRIKPRRFYHHPIISHGICIMFIFFDSIGWKFPPLALGGQQPHVSL